MSRGYANTPSGGLVRTASDAGGIAVGDIALTAANARVIATGGREVARAAEVPTAVVQFAESTPHQQAGGGQQRTDSGRE